MAVKKLKTRLNRLEAIADSLEENDLELEKAFALYAEGMALVKECGEVLDGYEEKVRVLSEGKDGLEEKVFDEESESNAI